MIAAAPSCNHQHAHLVCKVEKLVSFKFSFQADSIQIHVADVLKLRLKPLRRTTQQQVRSPSGAADQDVLAIDAEQEWPQVGVNYLSGTDVIHFAGLRRWAVEFGRDFANPEPNLLLIRNFLADNEPNVQRVKILWAKGSRPPEFRTVDA